jgi:hypothetical protein
LWQWQWLLTEETINDIKEHTKLKWAGIKMFLPSQTEPKQKLEEGNSVLQFYNMLKNDTASVGKIIGRVVSDLVKNVPLLTDTDTLDIF